MIYAEKRKEESGDQTHYTLRYLVYNGDDMVGSYSVHFGATGWDSSGFQHRPRPQDPEGGGFAYGASRDYHQLATPEQVEAYKAQQRYWEMDDAEQDAYYAEHGFPSAQTITMDGCCYLPDGPSICDGSGLVEVTLDDQRAFEIAAMMADLESVQELGN